MTFDWDAPVKCNTEHGAILVLCGNTGRYACTCDGMPFFDTPDELVAHLKENGVTALPVNILPRRLWEHLAAPDAG